MKLVERDLECCWHEIGCFGLFHYDYYSSQVVKSVACDVVDDVDAVAKPYLKISRFFQCGHSCHLTVVASTH
jgi:hypothetical protein